MRAIFSPLSHSLSHKYIDGRINEVNDTQQFLHVILNIPNWECVNFNANG